MSDKGINVLIQARTDQMRGEFARLMSAALCQRQRDLLGEIARAFREQRSPMNHEFLVAHEVTFNEMANLCELAAFAVEMFVDLAAPIAADLGEERHIPA